MIETRRKNQQAAQDVINSFASRHQFIYINESNLTTFTKELVTALINRAEDTECYLIDMLEDITRLGDA